jgi:hypothetical protein
VGSIETVTWQALTVILSLAGLLGTVLFWRFRGPVAGLRMLAVALLPAAAYLTGTLRLLWEVADAVVSWAVRFTFSPAVWLGLALALTSVALLVVTGRLRRRGAQRSPAPHGGELPGTPSRKPASPPRTSDAAASSAGSDDDDMADIEAILKRHGIS